MKSYALAIVGFFALATSAFGVSPSVRTMKPVGGQRGTEVDVTLVGLWLSDAQELMFYRQGISVSKIDTSKEGQITARFTIAADAPLGLHDFRVRTSTGVTSLRTFSVGVLPEINEVEPNNDFKKPQPIQSGVTINGVAENEDVDYYSIELKKGERITAEIEGIRLGLFLFDPYVSIFNTKRFELASSDDAALMRQDSFVSFVAPEDGTYIIQARESAYAGNANCLYRLHVGNFPRPTATIPSGGKYGDTVSVKWIGDPLGEMTSSVQLPSTPLRGFGLIAHDERGTAPYPNDFRLSPFGNTIEVEPNDTHADATPFVPPIALNGVIGSAGDVDLYRFKATANQTFDIRIFARQIRSPLDSVLSILAFNGARVAGNDDSGGPDSYLRFKAPRDGEFVISITDHLKKGGPDYAYRVEISPVQPNLVLSTPNESLRRGTSVMALAVPRGNRQSILINAARSDFGGALNLGATGLPAGTKFEADEMSATVTTIPFVVSADANAPIGATLANIVGKPVDSKLEVPCEFSSTAELVLGQNNIAFWTRSVDSLAVAVTEEAPFTIEAVTPKVPIVRGGSMELKVVAKRKPGFTAPIAISLPWNPPGIASKADTTIPENKDEATILINANNAAELKTWKIVVNGTYTEPPPAGTPNNGGGNQNRGRSGRLTVSTPLTDLTVAAPYLAFKFDAVTVEQGKTVDMSVKINKLIDFPGDAKVTLVGLPHKSSTEPTTITKDTSEIVFHIATDPAAPVGDNKNLFCQVIVTQNGEPIMHNLGTGRLRIDAPIAPKKDAKPAVAAAAAKPADPAAKPMSRLEKLRLESKERAKAAGGSEQP